jgi:DNA-binding HxlR family transcriptional regulator
MATYGQFCSVARAHEVLGGRWTLLVVRELLCGSRRFNDIRRGIPRISRTMLSERLQALVLAGAVERMDGQHGPEYALTHAGSELAGLVGALGVWGQRWLARHAADEDLDLEPLLVDMQRRVRFEALPKDPIVVRFAIQGCQPRLMLLRQEEAALCTLNPGFPEPFACSWPARSARRVVARRCRFHRSPTHGIDDRRAKSPRTRVSGVVRTLSVRGHRLGAGRSA